MGRILLVDDDEDMIAMTKRWLEKAGYEVKTAISGQEALDMMEDWTPELVLLDHRMPGMDGPEVLKRIRADAKYDGAKVYYRTGEDGGSGENSDGAKPDGVIPKSEGKPYLMRVVTEALSS